MKIDTAVVTIRGVRMAIAFPHSSWVRPGVGDDLLARLSQHFPALPIMLVNFDDGEDRAYAAFDAAPFFSELKLDDISLTELDLDSPLPEEAPPF